MDARKHIRTTIQDSLPPRGSVKNVNGHLKTPFNVLNYSKEGLGVWLVDQLEQGDSYNAVIGDNGEQFEIEVRWCQPSEDFGFNAGFLVKDLAIHQNWIESL